MTTVVGAGLGNASIYSFFSGAGYQFNSPIFYTALTPTSFTLLRENAALLVNGVGFTYTDLGNGTSYAVGGTITGLGFARGASSQGWAGSNVSITDALTAVAQNDELGFDNLFFGGDDTFYWTDVSGSNTAPILYGFGGNDVFNIGDMDANGGGRYHIDGGTGNDTLNLTGGVGVGYSISGLDLGSGNLSNFYVTNVETIRLAAGYNYTIIAPADIVTSGNTMTVDGSALGASDHLVFNTNVVGGSAAITGNLVLLGGAGDDLLEGGTGFNVFNGGGGSNTVSFLWSQQASHATGVIADLSNTGTQNFGSGWGSGTFTNIQNLTGTRWGDVLTGNAGDNVLNGGAGNDTLNGSAGFDTAVFSAPLSNYTITHSGGTTTVSGPDGTDTLTGVEMAQFSDQAIRISGPVVTTSNVHLMAGRTVALSTLFTVTDLNGAAITGYQLWDSTADAASGSFMVNNVIQAAHTIITITAAQLAQTTFVSAAGEGVDSLQIRAFDGNSWSAADNAAWAPFLVGPGIDNPPVVTTIDKSASRGQTLALSSLFTVSDADGDPITRYQLWDSNRDPNSGYFTINGVKQDAGKIINVLASDLANTAFVTGKVSDPLQIRAFDNYVWSAAENAPWAPFTVSVPADNAPVVTTSNRNIAAGRTLSFSSLVSVTDADGDPITQYQLWDSTRDPNAGYWAINGVAQVAGQVITISAAQAAQTTFVTGSVATRLQVRASDGILWSAADDESWAPFTVAQQPPLLTTSNQQIVPGTTVTLSTLFSASDPDGDAITQYQLWDATRDPNGGYFTINGTRQAAGTVINVSAAQLAQTSFVAGTVATSLQIRAYDNHSWSAADNAAWAPFTVSPPLPLLTTTDMTEAAGQTLALSSLFSVSDPNGLPITKYELWESTSDPNAGYFTINGVAQPAHTVIDITAAQLSQTAFVAGSVTSSLQIRAFDGLSWSAADNAAWAPFIVFPGDPPIVGTVGNITLPHGGYSTPLAGLISVVDPDGRAITKYQLWDSNRDPSSGYFTVNGVVKPAGTVIDITGAQLTQTNYVTGLVGDQLQVRAFDGVNWSAPANDAWAIITASVPDIAPVVTTHNLTEVHGTTVALSSLFTFSDADGDTATKYELWDSTRDLSSGHFVVNGVAQAAGTIIDITAAQLAASSFVTGSVGDTLQIRASDGNLWSAGDNVAWAPFTITPTDNPPVVTTTDKTATAGQSFSLSSLFSVNDADGDTITKYELWESTSGGHFVVNGVAQPAHTIIDITAAQLSQASFVAGSSGMSDALQIRAFDGFVWSAGDTAAWAPFHINVS